jgi:hypothetical protein
MAVINGDLIANITVYNLHPPHEKDVTIFAQFRTAWGAECAHYHSGNDATATIKERVATLVDFALQKPTEHDHAVSVTREVL